MLHQEEASNEDETNQKYKPIGCTQNAGDRAKNIKINPSRLREEIDQEDIETKF